MATNKRWKNRPENSTWGDYGADDQLGRMNELTPEKVKQGIAEVKEGKTFCLSMPLDYPGRRRCSTLAAIRRKSGRRCATTSPTSSIAPIRTFPA